MHELTRTEPHIQIVWRAFELRPEPVPTLDPQGAYLRRVWASSVYPIAERLGVAMKLPPVQPRSRRAHEAAQWARLQGRFDAYHAAVFRAFFERGEDIGEIEVLVALAAELGLPGESLRQALHERTFEPGVLHDARDAQAMGINGVPAFVADRRAATTGVQPAARLRQLVEHVTSLGSRQRPPARLT